MHNVKHNIPKHVCDWFESCAYGVIAFSGGVDSSLVAWLANTITGSDRSIAVISASPSLKLSDLDDAKEFCGQHGIALKVIVTEELRNPDYFLNPTNRCFFCKHALYSELENFTATIEGAWMLNGTNADDLGDYRPGLKAATKFFVRSPLAELGMDKQAVRDLASSLGLGCWDKPASPCLSSRIPYGQRVTASKLRQIEDGEAYLNKRGFPIVRLRHFGDTARIEVPADRIDDLERIEADIVEQTKSIGFANCVLDQEGFVSGKLNRAVAGGGP